MSDNKTAAQARPGSATSLPPFLPSLEWMKQLSGGSTRFYGELCNLTAARLRAQADFVQGLARCDSPTDLLKQQMEFIQSSWKTYVDEASKAWGGVLKGTDTTQPRN